MRSGHCLKVWTKKQQVVSLSTAESEPYAASKTASEGLGIQSLARDLVIVCKLNLYLDANHGRHTAREGGRSETSRRSASIHTEGHIFLEGNVPPSPP